MSLASRVTDLAARIAAEFVTVRAEIAGVSGGSSTWTEVEIDFGTNPVRSKRFTVTDASVTALSRIVATGSSAPATGRVGNDWEWDSISFAASPGVGQFTLTAYASGRVRGPRKVLYQIS